MPDLCVSWSCKASNSKILVNISSPLPFSYYIFSTFLISKRVIYEVLIVKYSIHFYSGEVDVRTLTLCNVVIFRSSNTFLKQGIPGISSSQSQQPSGWCTQTCHNSDYKFLSQFYLNFYRKERAVFSHS